MIKEIKHTWSEDSLFCKVCGVNKLYWNTAFKTYWCKENPEKKKEENHSSGDSTATGVEPHHKP